MTIISAIPGGSGDAYARLVEGLRTELGCHDIGALADRIFEAEKADFHWQARSRERYLGQHFPSILAMKTPATSCPGSRS